MVREVWKDIEGYEGIYKISNLGRVKSLAREVLARGHVRVMKERIMLPHKGKYGYSQIGLYKNGKRRTQTVHRLVAEHFVPNPKKLPEVNHVDGNKDNNEYTNLEWCTRKENIEHAIRKKLIDQEKLSDKDVLAIRAIYASEGCTMKDLANVYGVSNTTIWRVIRRETYTNV